MRVFGRPAVTTACVLAALVAGPARAELWSDVDAASIDTLPGERWILPEVSRTLSLDTGALAVTLAQAPRERGGPAVELALPMPDGELRSFAITRVPVMAPELAERFPSIQTFVGRSVDPPHATVRCDWTPHGFHAMVLAVDGTIYIDPFRQGDVSHYLSYHKRDRGGAERPPFRCRYAEVNALGAAAAAPTHRAAAKASGAELRTYRAAVAATGEYTTFHGGTVEDGLAAIVTAMNRINGIYEREVAVRMILVANNDLIVYTSGGSDPYSNNDGYAMLAENQVNLDAVIGDANYDVGHVFSTGGGGIAQLGVPCETGWKAQGVTGSGVPVGDSFWVDYVAHEMGHQFDANHSFNGTTSWCGGGRWGPTAYEPGSASTIMSYAGLCGAENLQNHSDDYFHAISFDEIFAFTVNGNGNSCPTITATGNSPPSVDAGPDWTIPQSTPFTLSGSATDPDGDILSYGWEQFDRGAAAPPNTDNGNRPIFRSFPPVDSGERTLPRLSDILDNTTTLGESLPITNRVLTFRLIARDDRTGGAGLDFDTAVLSVTTSAGPFLVTEPNTSVTWTGAGPHAVSWDVAGTDAPPVSCAAVRILLSTDGGQSFPHVLATSTANDGTEAVTVAAPETTSARVKIECADNIFFDISDADFSLVGTSGAIFSDGFESGDTSAWSHTVSSAR